MTEQVIDEQASYRVLAQRLVIAEIEDVLTISDRDTPAGEQYGTVAAEVVNGHTAAHVLVETAALAGEAVIRLAQNRGEDPRATLHWLLTTEWTTADGTPTT